MQKPITKFSIMFSNLHSICDHHIRRSNNDLFFSLGYLSYYFSQLLPFSLCISPLNTPPVAEKKYGWSFSWLSISSFSSRMCFLSAWMYVHSSAHVSPECQNSIIVNIPFDGASGSGCWPSAPFSFGTELPTSGLCQTHWRDYVYELLCVCMCVYVYVCLCPCLSSGAVNHWMGNRFAKINQRGSINKRRPVPSSSGLRAWESSFAGWMQAICCHTGRHAGYDELQH